MEDRNQLIDQLKDMCLAVTENTYTDFIQQGRAILIKLHELGFMQEQVYTPLLQYHNSLEDGLSRDFIADIMDFVVGWCAPQWHVWGSDSKPDRTK